MNTGDYFTIQLERTAVPPDRLGGSHRFRAPATLSGRPFETFMLEIGLRSDPINQYDILATPDLLAFAEIEPAHIRAIPLEQHIAEKLHAYPRQYADDQPSSRVKDFIDIDIVLVSELVSYEFSRLRDVIVRLFDTLATHELPASVAAPPREWARAVPHARRGGRARSRSRRRTPPGRRVSRPRPRGRAWPAGTQSAQVGALTDVRAVAAAAATTLGGVQPEERLQLGLAQKLWVDLHETGYVDVFDDAIAEPGVDVAVPEHLVVHDTRLLVNDGLLFEKNHGFFDGITLARV